MAAAAEMTCSISLRGVITLIPMHTVSRRAYEFVITRVLSDLSHPTASEGSAHLHYLSPITKEVWRTHLVTYAMCINHGRLQVY